VNLTINGKEKNLPEEVNTITRLLEIMDVSKSRVAVEMNGEIVEPMRFAETKIQDRDRLEIVTFVGGG